jgi:cobalt-zinc-cadmium efflux system protein
MEGVPEGLELAQVSRTMAAGPGVQDVHDLHIWSLCPGAVALSAHATVDGTGWEEIAAIQGALKAALRDRFRIEHTTIQIECTQCSQGVAACVNS